MTENNLLIDHQLKCFILKATGRQQRGKHFNYKTSCDAVSRSLNKVNKAAINFDITFYLVPGSLCRRIQHYFSDEKQLCLCEKVQKLNVNVSLRQPYTSR